MTDETPSLDELRREIDEIDVAVHDLLMRRVALADMVGQVKGAGGPYIRPGREARILRRLIARHRGPLPKIVLVRIWREIISAMTALEGPYAVAVYAPKQDDEGLATLARAHYGSERPIRAHETVMGVIRAVSNHEATVGVLPLPRGEETDPWWRSLIREGADVPRIIARLPFAVPGRRPEGAEALAVSLAAPEASEQDHSFLVAENQARLSRGGFRDALTQADFHVVDMQIWLADGEAPLVLAEVEGFLDDDDPRLKRLGDDRDSPIGRPRLLGSYAVPLSAEELAPDPAEPAG